jgi:hypothetical protein
MNTQPKNENSGDRVAPMSVSSPLYQENCDEIDRWPWRYCLLFMFSTSLLLWIGIVMLGMWIFE